MCELKLIPTEEKVAYLFCGGSLMSVIFMLRDILSWEYNLEKVYIAYYLMTFGMLLLAGLFFFIGKVNMDNFNLFQWGLCVLGTFTVFGVLFSGVYLIGYIPPTLIMSFVLLGVFVIVGYPLWEFSEYIGLRLSSTKIK